MLHIIHKPRSVGISWLHAGQHAHFKLRYFIRDAQELRTLSASPDDVFAVLVGALTRVHDREALLVECQKLEDIQIWDKRLANVVHLQPLVFAVGITRESDLRKRQWTRGDVDQLPRWHAPHGVKFRIHEYAGQLPDCPANNALSAQARHLLFDGDEAFALRLTWRWLCVYGRRRFATNGLGAKLQNMCRSGVCRNHAKNSL